MKILGDRSPRTLGALALTGGLMAGSVFLVVLPGRAHAGIDIAIFVLFFGGGYFLIFRSCAELKNGIQSALWSEAQIGPLRSIAESPFTTFFLGLLFFLYVLIFFVAKHSIWRDVSWSGFVLMQAITQLQRALRPPAPRPSQGLPFQALAPISSEHWGER